MLTECMAAADALAREGVAAEVIDVATLKPLDMETILASVARSGRCVIVHEAARSAGLGAEIAAGLAEHGLYSLQAPVLRVAGYDAVMPLGRLESRYLPDLQRIVDAAHRALEAA
jgi:pyruvate dehydrogenase E1 component beta subunit